MNANARSLGVAVAIATALGLAANDLAAKSLATHATPGFLSGSPDQIFADGFDLTVDAGYGLISVAGRTLQLSATASGFSTLTWQQVEGPATPLNSTSILNPTLTLPTVASSQTLVYELTVSNGAGAFISDRVSVEVWVGANSAVDRTVLGNFSSRPPWTCDKLPVATPTVVITNAGATTSIVGNGIPAHTTGTFPSQANPNAITPQAISYQFTNAPALAAVPTEMRDFGVSTEGVKLAPETAGSYLNQGVWSYEAITPGLAEQSTSAAAFSYLETDCNNAHVQPPGVYHYHGLMEGLINERGETNGAPSRMILGGYAADGFPFYLRYGLNDPNDVNSGLKVIHASWELRFGTRPSAPGGAYDGTFRQDWEYVPGSGDIDRCGGRFGITPEYPGGIYHYTITDDYPYIPRCVSGTPDPSFRVLM